MRLQTVLSHSGLCSRRAALDYVMKGRVCVNDRVVTEPSTQVNPREDKITVDGKHLNPKSYDYILLNKPKGFVTTKKDRFAKKTVFSLLPKKIHHVSPVGRLDKDTEGLLLLTNDGNVAHRLTHPRFDIDKIYWVKVLGRLTFNDKTKIEKGLYIDGKKTAPAKISNMKYIQNQTTLTMTIHEGRKRQIRLMFGKLRYKVIYLKRISQGPLQLGRLGTGCWRNLNSKELEAIRQI